MTMFTVFINNILTYNTTGQLTVC